MPKRPTKPKNGPKPAKLKGQGELARDLVAFVAASPANRDRVSDALNCWELAGILRQFPHLAKLWNIPVPVEDMPPASATDTD